MFKTRPCGCKGIRSCKICELKHGVRKLTPDLQKKDQKSYVYCPFCKRLWPGWDIEEYKLHPQHSGDPAHLDGIELALDFITPEEEIDLVKQLDETSWDLSQSGRYKQNYGPKCNFKKKKVSPKNFMGYPLCTKFIQERFKLSSLLRSFQTVEQCSLDYAPIRGSSIDPHIDDCWIWGERIPTLSLCSDSVLTLTKFVGIQESTRYNVNVSFKYPRIVPRESIPSDIRDLNLKSTSFNDFTEHFNSDSSHLQNRVSSPWPVVRVPMPRRSLITLYGDARYEWEHCVLREDIKERRVCITYRELTPPFISGNDSEVGKDILARSKVFWDHNNKEEI